VDKMKSLANIPRRWRWLGMLLLTALLNGLAFYKMPIEEDVVASIERSRPKEADLFRQVQELGLFQNRLFIQILKPDLANELREKLPDFGYELVSLEPKAQPHHARLLQLLPFLPESRQEALLNEARIGPLVDQTLQALSLPGGVGLVRMLEQDPLGIGIELSQMLGTPSSQGSESFLVAVRSGPLDFEKVGGLYKYLRVHDKDLQFLSGDFFALENKETVQRDIAVCSLASLILGGLCFYAFSRQLKVLALLLVGTLFSTAIGLLVARGIDGVIYGLVLAFGSTFFSFNNESLVHGAGITRHHSRAAIIGMASAIGTTILGFLVLLFSASHMARQMALISLGSLIGFILFLVVFHDDVRGLVFRSVSLKRVSWTRKPSYAFCLVLFVMIFALPKPGFRTDLASFRFTSPYLEQQVERFTQATARFDFSGLQAVPLTPNTLADFQTWDRADRLQTNMFHPLRLYLDENEQAARLAVITPRLKQWLSQLQRALLEAGVRVNLPEVPVEALSVPAFLQLWSRLTPLPWTLTSDARDYLLLNTRQAQLLEAAIPLHPKYFYEWILNELAAQIGQLFLVGLALMVLYLIPWQRSAHKIALIFMPLLVALLVLQILFVLTDRSINIVHIMGASLVIAVALDYSSVLISTEHDPQDQGKVVLTGGLTLTSFGSLLLASHPLLCELGLIVFVGTGVAWVFALLSCRAEEEK